MRTMADAIVECAELVQRAVSMLSDIASNAAKLNEIGLQITRIEGKRKMSQNRSERDRAGVAAALSASENPSDRAVAKLIPR